MLLLKTALLLALAPLTIYSATTNFKILDGRPNIEKPAGTFISTTSEVCVTEALQHFSDGKTYVAAFHVKRFLCHVFLFSDIWRAFLSANLSTEPILKKEDGWITLIPGLDTKLVVFWKLDQISKGENFGGARALLDLDTASCKFTSEGGPGDASNVRYCKIDDESRAQTPLTRDNILLFDFSIAFTIGLWLKTSREGRCMLVGSSRKHGPGFALLPSTKKDQLTLAFGEKWGSMAVSTINSKNVNNWRHLSVVYQPPLGVTFFMNGENWPLMYNMTEKNKDVAAEALVLWQSHGGSLPFKGQMACVSIFQTAIPASDMKHLKDFCQ